MLSGIPLHGCGVPWPGTAGGVAEWRWEMLRVSRVDARSRRLRLHTCKSGAICEGGKHRCFWWVHYKKALLLAIICNISRNHMIVEIVTNYKIERF